MNNDRIDVGAKTLDAAIKKGLEKLGINLENAEWEIIQEPGFLKQCRISIGPKISQAVLAKQYAEKILELMGFDYVVEETETDEEILLNLSGVSAGGIIGYRGDVLDAFQYVLNVLTKNFDDDYKRITVDTENYRSKRSETLTVLAKNLEKKVRRTAKPVKLEYMNPFERRIIHTALQDSTFVDTSSEGDEPRRFVVISPKPGLKPRPDGQRERGGGKKLYGKTGGSSERRKDGGSRSGRNDFYTRDTETAGEFGRTLKSLDRKFEKSETDLPEEHDSKREPSFDGGVMKKLNFVYRSDKKKRR